jgi:hypothetical protein
MLEVNVDSLPSLDDVYRKFGETSEAAQLLKTELGTLLMCEQVTEEGLVGGDGVRATEIMRTINRDTLGALIRKAKSRQSVEEVEAQLDAALKARNRLIHSFYRKHNFRTGQDLEVDGPHKFGQRFRQGARLDGRGRSECRHLSLVGGLVATGSMTRRLRAQVTLRDRQTREQVARRLYRPGQPCFHDVSPFFFVGI